MELQKRRFIIVINSGKNGIDFITAMCADCFRFTRNRDKAKEYVHKYAMRVLCELRKHGYDCFKREIF